MKTINRIGNLYGFTGGSFAGMIYGIDGLAPTINTSGGGQREPLILVYEDDDTDKCDMRGSEPDADSRLLQKRGL